MCAVSFISDYYGQFQRYPTQPVIVPQPVPWPSLPATLPWTRETLDELKDIMRRLDSIDKKLGLAECEDPKKAEWMKAIEDRLTALEKAVS